MSGLRLADLRPGLLLLVTWYASVQFGEPLLYRLIRVLQPDTERAPVGWVWLDGYQLDPDSGDAVDRRQLFVQVAGLRVAERVGGRR